MHHRRSAAAILLLAGTLLAVPPSASAQQQSLAAALAELNRFRAANGVPAVTLNTKLTLAAQRHADDMAANNYFSHTGRDGSNAGTRISRAGYAWRTWGENIAWGYANWTAALNGWKNSSGHRRNMLNRAFVHVGLGVRDRKYVQVFAAPR